MSVMCGKLDKLREKISSYQDTPKVGIFMHSNPDPDCIGAAMGMEKVIRSINPDCQCTLIYSGEISHPQNKTMVNILKIMMKDRAEIEDLTEIGDFFIAVDVLPERVDLKGVECFLTIDHHKGDTKKSEHKDIRQVGSASAIVWDYLSKAGVNLSETDSDEAVATALAIGIRTDTQDLTENASELDFNAYQDLMKHVDIQAFKTINNYPIPPYHFELRKRLDQDERNMMLENGVFIGGVGYVPPSKRDALPTIADERSRVEGTNTAFVFAIVGDYIEVSVRSNSVSIDVDTLCKNTFGKENAGGKSGAGAAKIPMGFLAVSSEEELQESVWKAVREILFYKIKLEMSNYK